MRVVYGLPLAVPDTKYSFTTYFWSARPVPSGTRCRPGNMAPGPVTGALIIGIGAVLVWADALAAASITSRSTSLWNMGDFSLPVQDRMMSPPNIHGPVAAVNAGGWTRPIGIILSADANSMRCSAFRPADWSG